MKSVVFATVIYQTAGDILGENWRVFLGVAVVGIVAWGVERIWRRRRRRLCNAAKTKRESSPRKI